MEYRVKTGDIIDVTITGLEESKGVMIITDADNSKIIADALNTRSYFWFNTHFRNI